MIDKLYEITEIKELREKYDLLGGKVFSFIQYVEKNWKSWELSPKVSSEIFYFF